MRDKIFPQWVQTVWFGFFYARSLIAVSKIETSDNKKVLDDNGIEQNLKLIMGTEAYQLAVFQYAFLLHYLSLGMDDEEANISIAQPFLVLQVKAMMLGLQMVVDTKNRKNYLYNSQSLVRLMGAAASALDNDARETIGFHSDVDVWFRNLLVRYYALCFKKYLFSIQNTSMRYQDISKKYHSGEFHNVSVKATDNYLKFLDIGFLGLDHQFEHDLSELTKVASIYAHTENMDVKGAELRIVNKCDAQKINDKSVALLAQYALSGHTSDEFQNQIVALFATICSGFSCMISSQSPYMLLIIVYVNMCETATSKTFLDVSFLGISLCGLLKLFMPIIYLCFYGSESQAGLLVDSSADELYGLSDLGYFLRCLIGFGLLKVFELSFFYFFHSLCVTVSGLSSLFGWCDAPDRFDYTLVHVLKCLASGDLNMNFQVTVKKNEINPPNKGVIRMFVPKSGRRTVSQRKDQPSGLEAASHLQLPSYQPCNTVRDEAAPHREAAKPPRHKAKQIKPEITKRSMASPMMREPVQPNAGYCIKWRNTTKIFCYDESSLAGSDADNVAAYPVFGGRHGRGPSFFVSVLGFGNMADDRMKRSIVALCVRGKTVSASSGDQGFISKGEVCKMKLLGRNGKGDQRNESVDRLSPIESSDERDMPLYVFEADNFQTHRQINR